MNSSDALEFDLLFSDSVEQNYNLDVIRHLMADLKIQLLKKLKQLAIFTLSLPLITLPTDTNRSTEYALNNILSPDQSLFSNYSLNLRNDSQSFFNFSPFSGHSYSAVRCAPSFANCSLTTKLSNLSSSELYSTNTFDSSVQSYRPNVHGDNNATDLLYLLTNHSQNPFEWLDRQLFAIRWQLNFLSSVDLHNRTQLVRLIRFLQHIYTPSTSSVVSPFNRAPSIDQIFRNLFIIVSFLLVMICSAAGNLLVCITVLRRARHRISRINLLIANLSFSDLFIALFNIPMNISRILLDNWPFGEQLCKLG